MAVASPRDGGIFLMDPEGRDRERLTRFGGDGLVSRW